MKARSLDVRRLLKPASEGGFQRRLNFIKRYPDSRPLPLQPLARPTTTILLLPFSVCETLLRFPLRNLTLRYEHIGTVHRHRHHSTFLHPGVTLRGFEPGHNVTRCAKLPGLTAKNRTRARFEPFSLRYVEAVAQKVLALNVASL